MIPSTLILLEKQPEHTRTQASEMLLGKDRFSYKTHQAGRGRSISEQFKGTCAQSLYFGGVLRFAGRWPWESRRVCALHQRFPFFLFLRHFPVSFNDCLYSLNALLDTCCSSRKTRRVPHLGNCCSPLLSRLVSTTKSVEKTHVRKNKMVFFVT